MKWRFDDIVAFVRVVEAGSLTAAAERLNLSKSAVSRRISDLEKSLGVELFRRSTDRLRLTLAGHTYYKNVVPLMRNLNGIIIETSAKHQAVLSGELRIFVPVSFGAIYLRPTIAAFARRHPKLRIVVEYDDRRIGPVEGGYDVGIRIGYSRDDSSNVIRLCECPRLLCCSPIYASERGLPVTLNQLNDHTAIGYAHIPQEYFWAFENATPDEKRVSYTMPTRAVVNTGEAVRDMVLAGVGIAPMPIFTSARQLREGSLVPILSSSRLPKFAFELIHYPIFPVPHHIQEFIDHLKRFFAPPHPWEADLEHLHMSHAYA